MLLSAVVRLARGGSKHAAIASRGMKTVPIFIAVPAVSKRSTTKSYVGRVSTLGSVRSAQSSSQDSAWAEQFKRATVDLASMDIHAITYDKSAERMRTLLKTGLLKHADLHDNPERFFLAHRLLAHHAPKLGPGFWIRFTVHYNLCVGTVLALGSAQQVEDLKGNRKVQPLFARKVQPMSACVSV